MKKRSYYKSVISLLESGGVEVQPNSFDFEEFDVGIKDVISRNLMILRKGLEYSQANFAKLIEVSTSQYKKYESGVEIIRLDVAHRIGLKLGYPIFHLLSGSAYDRFIDTAPSNNLLRRLCYFSNSLTDHRFNQLCMILQTFSRRQHMHSLSVPPSGLSRENFSLALDENHNEIYVAIGEGIRAVRQYMNFSQEKVADLMRVSLKTYREYEKASQRPRFNLLVSIHYVLSMGIHPFSVLNGTYFVKIRRMQNQRIQVIYNITQSIDDEVFQSLYPIIDGFFESTRHLPNSQFYSLAP